MARLSGGSREEVETGLDAGLACEEVRQTQNVRLTSTGKSYGKRIPTEASRSAFLKGGPLSWAGSSGGWQSKWKSLRGRVGDRPA